MNKTCLIYNYAQHYRKGIFELLDKELKIDFYFGDKMQDVKKLDYNNLKGFKKELNNISLFLNFYWQKGALGVFFNKYDKYIMLGEYYCVSTWLILFLSKFTSKKVMLWTHGWYGKETRLISLVKKLFFFMADDIFLYGNYAKNLMIKEGFNPQMLHVIYNSLDYEEQLKIRGELKRKNVFKKYFGNDFPVLIFIGRLTKIKKLDYILQAQKNLVDGGFSVNLVIIGDGEEKELLEDKVKRLRLQSSVWFIGKLYEEKLIANYIYNADLCVSPGNVGLTAMHSMVYGTPVISHDNFSLQMPEFEAVKKGETGDFFKYDNIKSLTKSIEFWLKININREFTRSKCFKRIDTNFNPNYQLNVIQNVLSKYNTNEAF